MGEFPKQRKKENGWKFFVDCFTKQDIQINRGKDVLHTLSRKCKLKKQWNTTIPLLQCPIFGILSPPDADKDVE